jgi:hypothetical protein
VLERDGLGKEVVLAPPKWRFVNATPRHPLHSLLAENMKAPKANVVVESTRIGMGIVAARTFSRGQVIDRIPGRVEHHSVLWRRRGSFAANCIRFGPNTYLDPSSDAGRYLNHSCEPNAGIRKRNNQLFLFAAKRIRKGTEIVIDYSTTLGDDDIWTMRCRCGTDGCRRTVRRFGSLPLALQAEYVRAGLVPRYIIETLEPDPSLYDR